MTPVLPDVEGTCIAYLKAHAGVTALVPAARIRGLLPSGPPWPFLTVRRIGGTPTVAEWLDGARIELQAWGASDPAASELIRTARAALFDMPGVHADAVVTGVDDDIGPQNIPDETLTPAPSRYVATVTVYAHP